MSVPTRAVADLIDDLDRALDAVGGPDHAAFATDGDGTLWSGDVGEAFFEMALERGLVGEPAREALRVEALTHRVDAHPSDDAPTIARALFAAYTRGEYAEDRTCAMIAWCVAGRSIGDVARACRALLDGGALTADRLQNEAMELVRWAARRRVPIWLVSASPRVVVEAASEIIGRHAGIAPPPVLAMTPTLLDGVVQPEVAPPWTYGPGKAHALDVALEGSGRAIVGAMGDSGFDADMLVRARVPVAIRPKMSLIARASSIAGLTTAQPR